MITRYLNLDRFNAALAIVDQRGALQGAKEEGKAEGKAELVRLMHGNGASIETICQLTQLPIQDIQNLL